MKATLLLAGATTLLAANLVADPADLVKQRAKELINQNNVRQSVAPPTQPPQSAPTAAQPPQPQSLVRLDAVLNPAKYPQAKMQAIFDDIQAIFQEKGLDRKHAAAISEDVKALVPR